MHTISQGATRVSTGFGTILAVALFGMAVVFFAGFAQSAALHDAAHDVRHATGFPCH